MDPYQAQIITKIIDIAGGIIARQMTKPDFKAQEKIIEKYYEDLKKIKEEKEKKPVEHPKQIEEKTEAKGTACLPCSKNHFSTVSASLNEAIRFARTGGIQHPEVIRRIGIAIDELNIMERIDLSPENIVKLSENEREIANWALIKSRELRHMLDELETLDDLEKTAAKASEIRTEFLTKLWKLTKKIEPNILIQKICINLSPEEKTKCENAIKEVMENKEEQIKKILKDTLEEKTR